MKRFFSSAMVATAIGFATMVPATAQNQDQPNQTPPRSQQQQQTGPENAGKLDSKTRGANIRVSQLMGANIQNSQGESVGEIKDIVLDAKSGKVQYAAVTYGGFLGLGNKMFAVPFAAFKVQVAADQRDDRTIDSGDYVLILNVTQQQLEGQQGFDEDAWPNMADAKWAADLDKRYGVNRNEDAKDRLLRENRDRNRE
jgi:sporulation protein YlmC with PRC-barrel domain